MYNPRTALVALGATAAIAGATSPEFEPTAASADVNVVNQEPADPAGPTLQEVCEKNSRAVETRYKFGGTFTGAANVRVFGTVEPQSPDCVGVAVREKATFDIVQPTADGKVIRTLSRSRIEVTGQGGDSFDQVLRVRACQKGVKRRRVAERLTFVIGKGDGVDTTDTTVSYLFGQNLQRCKPLGVSTARR